MVSVLSMDTKDFTAFQRALGRNLQTCRKRTGMSQEAAGEAVGLDRVSIGYIEQGRRAPKLKTLYALSIAYGVTLPELFTFTTEE